MAVKALKKNCPECGSEQTKDIQYFKLKCIMCDNCGYDERCVYEVDPTQKTSQKAKARHSPYKAGGKGRTRKKKK